MLKLKKEQIVGANYHYTRYSFQYFLDSMQRLGLQKIELYAADPHLYVEDFTPQMTREIKKKLDSAGISVICYTPEQCSYPINIALEDEYVRQRSIRYFERTIEQAELLGSPKVQIVGGRGYFDGNLDFAWERSAESLYKIAQKAKSCGITLVLEASSYTTSTVINTCSSIAKMIKQIDLPNFKGMIDTNALFKAEENFEECVRLLGDNLVHMHFIDATPTEFCLIPGDGDLPMGDFMNILARHGYEGFLTPELWGTRYACNPEKAMKQCLDFCYRYTD